MDSRIGNSSAVSVKLWPLCPLRLGCPKPELPGALTGCVLSRFFTTPPSLLLLEFFEIHHIADRRLRLFNGASGQFENHRRTPVQPRDPKRPHAPPEGDDLPIAVQEHDVDRKEHAQCMHALR